MKKIITISHSECAVRRIFLFLVLLMFVSCGPKGDEPQVQKPVAEAPKEEVKKEEPKEDPYILPEGNYLGGGELFKEGTTEEEIKAFYEIQNRMNELNFLIEKSNTDKEKEILKKEHTEKTQILEDLREKHIAFDFYFVQLSIAEKVIGEKEKDFHVKNFLIKTTIDKEEDKENKIKENRFFGEDKDIRLKETIDFNPKEGTFSIVFARTEKGEVRKYIFKGSVSRPQESEDRIITHLVGDVVVQKEIKTEFKPIQRGSFKARHTVVKSK